MSSVLAYLGQLLAGKKTYLTAAGLAGLAVYEFSQGDYPAASKTLLGAMAAVGLRSAIATTPAQ